MSKWCLFALIIVLSGCSVIAPPKYSETEYVTLARMSTVVELGKCDAPTTKKLLSYTVFLDHYTKHLPNNSDTQQAVLIIRKQVTELDAKIKQGSEISDTYCQTKLTIIGETIDALAASSGGKAQ